MEKIPLPSALRAQIEEERIRLNNGGEFPNIFASLDGCIDTINFVRSYFESEKQFVDWLIYFSGEIYFERLKDLQENINLLKIIKDPSQKDVRKIKPGSIADKIILELNAYQEKLSKYSGKKVSKTRIKIYGEIRKKYSELNEEGADIGYRTAVNIIAKKYKKNPDKLYQSFKKWQNRQNAKSK